VGLEVFLEDNSIVERKNGRVTKSPARCTFDFVKDLKCWILAAGEDWIVDRMVREFREDNPEICTDNIDEANVVWALADWCFDKIPKRILDKKIPIVTTCHHYVPSKFRIPERKFFESRDAHTTAYTAHNFRTRDFIANLTDKPIHIAPSWGHVPTWKKTGTKEDFRHRNGIPQDAFVIGSFQRDTEGNDLQSPKLEKGVDLLADFIVKKNQERKVHVLLAGWRRQYIMKRLSAAEIPVTYIELPDLLTINELYQCIDLYPVCSRFEGGPQALIECGLLGIPVVSRPVGMAEVVLSASAINDDVSLATPEVPNVEHLKTPVGYEKYIEVLRSVLK
jgi:glycosyltransferase involved in cell wall biosynthesis